MDYNLINDKYSPRNDLITIAIMLPVWILFMAVCCCIYSVRSDILDLLNPSDIIVGLIVVVFSAIVILIPVFIFFVTLFSLCRLLRNAFLPKKDALKCVVLKDNWIEFVYNDKLLNYSCTYNDVVDLNIIRSDSKYILPRKAHTSVVYTASKADFSFTLNNGKKVILEKQFNAFLDNYKKFQEQIEPYLSKFENVTGDFRRPLGENYVVPTGLWRLW